MYKKGFTLVELIVVMGILSIIVLIASQPLVNVIKYQRESQTSDNMRDNLQFIINSMSKELTTSSNLSVTGGGTGLSFKDQENRDIEYSFSDNKIIRTQTSDGTSIDLTDTNIFRVDNVKFIVTNTPWNPDLGTFIIKASSLDNKDNVVMQGSISPRN